MRLVEFVEQNSPYLFILETNGILIGSDPSYAKDLARFERLHVRVSLKGTNEEEFAMLTGATPDGFKLQLQSLKNLLDAGVSCHPAVMLSFSPKESYEKLEDKLASIDARLVDELEEEYVFLYPHVVKRLRAAKLRPLVAYKPSSIPEELV